MTDFLSVEKKKIIRNSINNDARSAKKNVGNFSQLTKFYKKLSEELFQSLTKKYKKFKSSIYYLVEQNPKYKYLRIKTRFPWNKKWKKKMI